MADLSGVIIIVLFFFFVIVMVAGCFCVWVASVLGFLKEGTSRWFTAFFFMSPVLLIVFLALVSRCNSPVRLDKSDVVGQYEIDRSFYAGEQAEWQHETYEMEITDDELILHDARTETVWRYPIEWSWRGRGRWGFENAELRHHLVRNGPTLYRRTFTHYYVFKSPHYGNVFFSRKSLLPVWLMWGGVVVFLCLSLWWCFRKRDWELVSESDV